jgi:hypothetical protein
MLGLYVVSRGCVICACQEPIPRERQYVVNCELVARVKLIQLIVAKKLGELGFDRANSVYVLVRIL